MDKKYIFGTLRDPVIVHYGLPRRSGRYPWGSGKNPYHHDKKRDMTHMFKYISTTNKDGGMASVEIMRTDDLQPTDKMLKYVKNL